MTDAISLAPLLTLALPSDMLSPHDTAHCLAWARQSPASGWAGIEIPFNQATDNRAKESAVDFHQGFTHEAHGPALLRAFTESAVGRTIFEPETRKRIQDFCCAWGAENADASFAALLNVVLEYDVRPHTSGAPSTPAIFVAIDPSVVHATDASLSEHTNVWNVWDATMGMLAANPMRAREIVRHCLTQCPPTAYVSHIGVMLGRGDDVLRINIKGVSSDAIADTLRALEWPGRADAVEADVAWLSAWVDRLTLCIDIIDGCIGSRVGVECGIEPVREHHWNAVFHELIERGLCTHRDRDHCLAWSARLIPPESPYWPRDLVMREILGPVDRFGVIDRYISHAKLSWLPTGQPRAKGYLGITHRWIGAVSRMSETHMNEIHASETSPPPLQETSLSQKRIKYFPLSTTRITTCLESAMTFLLRARSQSGWWIEYPHNGSSDEWVTAYIGSALVEMSHPTAQRAAAWAWRLLSHRRPGAAGWGYNASTPSDADSTAWGLRLAIALGVPETPVITRARDFLSYHHRADYGYATYNADPHTLTFINNQWNDVSADGWCTSHPCVSAAIAGIPYLAQGVIPYLHATQQPDGRWTGYWWVDDEYTTALAGVTFAGTPSSTLAAQWAAQRIQSDGSVHASHDNTPSAFCTAWCLWLLSHSSHIRQYADQASRAAAWLAETQQTDGSWTASATLRIPPSNVLNPTTPHAPNAPRTIIASDTHATMTTATVLRALHAFSLTSL